MGAYGIGQDVAQWAATAFLATMVASQLLNSWVVRAVGQRTAYTMTLIIFFAGAFVCTFSPNIDVLIIGRMMQGFSAGIIQPLVLATMVAVFPKNKTRVRCWCVMVSASRWHPALALWSGALPLIY